MERTMEQDVKNEYLTPQVDLYHLEMGKDVLCMSNEGNDNDFDAGGLGNFGG